MGEVKQGLIDAQKKWADDYFGRSQCEDCKHYKGEGKCKAFPKGIPIDVSSNSFIHNEQHYNQENNILFEAK